MNYISKAIFLLHWLACADVSAQEISIGQSCTDLPITKLINYHSSEANVSDFTGKALIFDFMSLSCIPCMRALPELDSLQRVFGDKIQIIVVTLDKQARIEKYLNENSIGKTIRLPFSVENDLLSASFPHVIVPHEVWIDQNATVKAITSGEYITAQNIRSVLNSAVVNWPLKKDISQYDYQQPLYVLNESNIGTFSIPNQRFYSAFTQYLDGVSPKDSYSVDSSAGWTRLSFINLPIIDLYLRLLGKSSLFPIGFMQIKVKNRSRVVYNHTNGYLDEWKQRNCYSYEAVLPLNISEKTRIEKMRGDLNLYLGVNGRLENRTAKCAVLISTDKSRNKRIATGSFKKLEKGTDVLSGLFYYLSNQAYGMPALNETLFGEDARVGIRFDANKVADLPSLNRALAEYGLKIILAPRTVEMFVLSDQ